MLKMLSTTVLLLLTGLAIFMGIRYQDKKVLEEFDLFYLSSLSGKVVKVDKYSRGAKFTLSNSTTEYIFYPYTNERLNGNKIFEYWAAPGDSICKKEYADTLTLIKHGIKYRYCFKKYKN